MARSDQKAPVSPPSPADMEHGLQDFSAVLQRNLEDLFELVETTLSGSTVPTSDVGNIGDRYLFDNGTTTKLYIKFPVSGWKSVTFS